MLYLTESRTSAIHTGLKCPGTLFFYCTVHGKQAKKVWFWSGHWFQMFWIHSHWLLQEPDWTLRESIAGWVFCRETSFPKNGHLSEHLCSKSDYWKHWKGGISEIKKRKIFIDFWLRQLYFHFPQPDSALVWLLKMSHLHPHTHHIRRNLNLLRQDFSCWFAVPDLVLCWFRLHWS